MLEPNTTKGKHSGGTVKFCGCFAAPGPEQFAIIERIMPSAL